jgi:hypothetical protein
MKLSALRVLVVTILAIAISSVATWAGDSGTNGLAAGWKPHMARRLNGAAAPIPVPAKLQIVTQSWNRVVAVPYIVYMPEKKRLLMLVACDYPHRAMLLTSDDLGGTWTKPRYLHVDAQGKPDAGMATNLIYLGNGKAMLTEESRRWFSDDYGETWRSGVVPPLPDGKLWNAWDPQLVEKDPGTGKVVRLVETGYSVDTAIYEAATGAKCSQGYLRFSTDEGSTWTAPLKVPQWHGVNEVALLRATNGEMIAACRTDIPLKGTTLDHYEGLGVSISKDDGRTWSDLNMLYHWGRHHPSMVRLPGGQIVMTYVVRLGYVRTADDLPQYGIEAVVSRDHGRTWDLDHRYLLQTWTGNWKGPNKCAPGRQEWWASSQATSSVLLLDGSILTAFGTGYRSQTGPDNQPTPRDVGLVLWRPVEQPLDGDRTIRDAPFDSDLRNVVDPATGKPVAPAPTGGNAGPRRL